MDMRIVKKCIECGHKRPISRGHGNKFWCEDCLYLADDLPEVVTKEPVTKRKRIRWKMGEREDGEGPSSV